MPLHRLQANACCCWLLRATNSLPPSGEARAPGCFCPTPPAIACHCCHQPLPMGTNTKLSASKDTFLVVKVCTDARATAALLHAAPCNDNAARCWPLAMPVHHGDDAQARLHAAIRTPPAAAATNSSPAPLPSVAQRCASAAERLPRRPCSAVRRSHGSLQLFESEAPEGKQTAAHSSHRCSTNSLRFGVAVVAVVLLTIGCYHSSAFWYSQLWAEPTPPHQLTKVCCSLDPQAV